MQSSRPPDLQRPDESPPSRWRWVEWILIGIVALPIMFVLSGLYSALGSSLNVLYLLIAIGVLVGVTLLTLRWLSEPWMLVTVPATIAALVPSMRAVVKMNKKMGFD